MKIAFLHYHLKPGGVTTVIRHQIEALERDNHVLVLSGAPSSQPFPAPVRCVPGIGYDGEENYVQPPEKIAETIHNTILAQWKEGCDLLHIHNPVLAKNKSFLKIINALQNRGIKLFLQIHDFAEDGRPRFFFKEPYPKDCHYGVINSRDYGYLLQAGLQPEGLHYLPNPVKPLDCSGSTSEKTGKILYPVRAIRRKNIGEALLLSLFFKHSESLCITLPPNSTVDMNAYEGWKQFSKENHLNVHFDCSLDNDFEDLVDRSSYLVTTSITEGFGYTFLEAWTAGKLVCGRDLAGITSDFKQKGLDLNHLYPCLRVPLAWIDGRLFFERWQACILENCTRFGLNLKNETLENKIRDIRTGGRIDFGLLDESFQKSVVRKLLADPIHRNYLAEHNPFLVKPVSPEDFDPVIDTNRRVIAETFGFEAYRRNLLDTYRAVVRGSIRQRIKKKRLAASFLDLDSFSLLKWGPYVES